MSTQIRFNKEYKQEIIKLVTEQGKKATHFARDIGVSEATVRGWVKKYKATTYSDHNYAVAKTRF